MAKAKSKKALQPVRSEQDQAQIDAFFAEYRQRPQLKAADIPSATAPDSDDTLLWAMQICQILGTDDLTLAVCSAMLHTRTSIPPR